MMTPADTTSTHDDVQGMLPWYVNSTLADDDRDRVDAHLQICDQCRADVTAFESMQSAVLGREIEPIIPTVSAADIIAGGAAPGRKYKRTGLNQYLAVAATVAAVAIAVWLYADQRREELNQEFRTATSAGEVSSIDYVLQLRFGDDVSLGRRGDLLQNLDGMSKWTMDENGVYTVHLRLSNPTLAVLEEFEQQVRSLPEVRSADFVALQVPVR